MSRHVLISPRQKIPSADINNFQYFKQAAIDTVVKRGITPGRYYTGFSAAKTGPVEVTVSAGEYWSDGLCYIRLTQHVQDLFNFLPVVTRKYVAVVTWGVTQQIDPQSHDFITNPDTRESEQQTVSIEEQRSAMLNFIGGVESAAPVKPATDATTTAIAWVLLDPSGIVSIEAATQNVLPSVDKNAAAIAVLDAFRTAIAQQVATLGSEQARMWAAIPPDYGSDIAGILAELQRLRELAAKPATAVRSFIERYRSTAESDLAADGYNAVIKNGLRFPSGATANAVLELLNPYEPRVTLDGGLTTPAATKVTRLSTIGDSDGSLSINSYPITATEMITEAVGETTYSYSLPTDDYVEWNWPDGTIDFSRTSLWALIPPDKHASFHARYGAPVVGSVANMGQRLYGSGAFPIGGGKWIFFPIGGFGWNPGSGGGIAHWTFRWQIMTVTPPAQQERIVTSTETVPGSKLGDVFLNPSSGWLDEILLPFEQAASSGDVKVMLCEIGGDLKPDTRRVISQGSVPAANLVTSEEGVAVPMSRVYLDGSKRYGLVVSSPGNHFLRTTTAPGAAQSTLYYLDAQGQWQATNPAAHLCFALRFRRFTSTRFEVDLKPVQLAGGISEIDVVAAAVVPKGCSLGIEVMNAGRYVPLNAPSEYDAVDGNPSQLPMRLVFSGTEDLMPGIDLARSKWYAKRPSLTMKEVSAQRVVPATATVTVDQFVEGWDGDHHTLTTKLIIGGSAIAHSTIQTTTDPVNPKKIRRTLSWTGLSAVTAFAVQTEGVTTEAGNSFVVTERWDNSF